MSPRRVNVLIFREKNLSFRDGKLVVETRNEDEDGGLLVELDPKEKRVMVTGQETGPAVELGVDVGPFLTLRRKPGQYNPGAMLKVDGLFLNDAEGTRAWLAMMGPRGELAIFDQEGNLKWRAPPIPQVGEVETPGKWVRALPSGVKVELVAVSGKGDPPEWWRPDGSAIEEKQWVLGPEVRVPNVSDWSSREMEALKADGPERLTEELSERMSEGPEPSAEYRRFVLRLRGTSEGAVPALSVMLDGRHAAMVANVLYSEDGRCSPRGERMRWRFPTQPRRGL